MNLIETRAVAPGKRARYWQEQVGRLVGLKFDVATRARPLEATSIWMTIDSVTVGEVSGVGHSISNSGFTDGFGDVCAVVVPRISGGRIEHDGHERPLAIDRPYLLDDRSRWSLTEPARFRHLVLVVARPAVPCLARSGARRPDIRPHAATVAMVELTKLLVDRRLDTDHLPSGNRKAISDMLCGLLDTALEQSDDEAGGVGSPAARERYHKQRIREYALAHLADPLLCIDSIASAIGLSTRHVHRLFAEEAIPLGKWIWNERLDRCHAELAVTGVREPVSEIAYAWGFRDAAHFSRAFRRRFGTTPRQVRGSRARGD